MLFRKNKELYSVRDRSNSFYVCLVYINWRKLEGDCTNG
jgi:hypothetical protein